MEEYKRLLVLLSAIKNLKRESIPDIPHNILEHINSISEYIENRLNEIEKINKKQEEK